MKNYIVKEYDAPINEESSIFDLSRKEIKHCIGCWACWWTTPGRCVHKDLDEFYTGFLAADKVSFYCNVSQGFVTSNMKALLDRMIPLLLPYTSWPEGESIHDPRYSKYPSVEVIYRGEFLPGEEEAFIAYWKRTFGMIFTPGFSAKRDENNGEGRA
jgi:hypothetical protein